MKQFKFNIKKFDIFDSEHNIIFFELESDINKYNITIYSDTNWKKKINFENFNNVNSNILPIIIDRKINNLFVKFKYSINEKNFNYFNFINLENKIPFDKNINMVVEKKKINDNNLWNNIEQFTSNSFQLNLNENDSDNDSDCDNNSDCETEETDNENSNDDDSENDNSENLIVETNDTSDNNLD